ncbi:type I-B CRISPR-associated protein Cas5b [Isachenkonia alkalipeptolytica]|uniref:Type I-B CRISPR-associated protein Cas5 n=1 Tax=Isachenkonia alkalipeptolytica TaxID=2565777 RepID=A0AA43XJH6_9CLOT|nr:type I-B CRISPR-associated protein Cas5b [Isachenkonia alkalipeptolytica]NBG87369.1 type I-B CRISPR-associated protein Cas5 [Isachenkonia alkalipeptolytica]
MKILSFTASGSYARFRCSHTTTSALTYSSIHPVAVRGLIGAMLGIEYHELYEKTKDLQIGIKLLNPVIKDTQAFNLIPQTKNNSAANFQSRIQFLRDPAYQIYVQGESAILSELQEVLTNRNFVFTPYLGNSEHIAKVDFVGLYDPKTIKSKFSDTIMVKELVDLEKLDMDQICFDRIPIMNNATREYKEYQNVVMTPQNRTPLRKEQEVFKVGEDHVCFL